MNIDYQKWWSSHLSQEMELKVYGHSGKPILVFPTQAGRFFEYEDFGMVETCRDFIEQGKITFFTVDSIDAQSWVNWNALPPERVRRHEDYDLYITKEVVPYINARCGDQKIITTGCSMGGYHSANFFFRHPEQFDGVICLSGVLQLKMFVGEYMDDLVYFNSPLYFMRNLSDPNLLNLFRKSRIMICVGQGAWEEEMLRDARQMQAILDSKAIPHWVDYWGHDVNHDWPWWRKQMPYFLEKILAPSN